MKVLSVRKIGIADVYNMEVDETHDFIIQGGVVAHNCADETRYFCMTRPIKPRLKEVHMEIGDDPLNQRVPKRRSIYVQHR